MRGYKRQIDRTIRDLDREREKMQMQEKKLIQEMKTLAKQNQLDAVKIIAKDMIRTRGHVRKFYKMRAQMQGVSLKLLSMESSQKMAMAMQGVARTMRVMNARMNIPQMQKIMKSFAMESEKMEMKDETMNEMLDDTMEEENEEAETNEIVSALSDELGIDLSGQMGETGGKLKGKEKTKEAEDDEFAKRLENLKK